MDVYIHGDTPGGNWARQVKPDDVVHATADYHEQIDHLQQGHAVLFADEASLPTVATIVEQWHDNPLTPTVVCVTADAADPAYLSDELLPTGSVVHRLVQRQQSAEPIIEFLQTLPRIDAA